MSSRLKFAVPGTALAVLAVTVAIESGTFAGAQGIGGLGDVPPGTVVEFAGATPPPGWLPADGSEVSRTQYPELFAAIGVTYGTGNTSTTFNLPDLRGRVVVGKGTNIANALLGQNDGLAVGSRKIEHKHGKGTLAIGPSGAHTHGVNDPGHVHSHVGQYGQTHPNEPGDNNDHLQSGWGGTSRDVPGTQTESATTGITIQSATHTHPNADFTGFVGDTSGPTDAPAHIVLNYIIKS
jgi:microcystin-dependent protein